MATLALERHPKLRFLFMSGYSEDVASKHVPEGPAGQFLSKPFTPHQLARAVRAALA